MRFQKNLLVTTTESPLSAVYVADYFVFTDWFHCDPERLILIISSTEKLRLSFDKILLKNYDVFVRTLHVTTCHQVLMEWQMTPASKLITIFDSLTLSLQTFHDKFIMFPVCLSSEKLLAGVRRLIICEPSRIVSAESRGKNYYLLCSIRHLVWSSIFFHHRAAPYESGEWRATVQCMRDASRKNER